MQVHRKYDILKKAECLQKRKLCVSLVGMVRLINSNNLIYLKHIVNGILKTQEIFTIIKSVGHPDVGPCLYAIWHGNQFCLYGIPNRGKVNVLVRTSMDGDIISYCTRNLGLRTIRGSTARRGSVGGTMQILDALKNGESAAIMVDGPKGPVKKVKGGIIKIAHMANVPIVPVHWYSPQFNFVKLPSWDSLTMPLLYTRLINIYGTPIYIPKDLDAETEKIYQDKIKESLINLEAKAPQIYKEVKKEIPWKLNLDLNYPRYN